MILPRQIQSVLTPPERYWIDMETKVRTDDWLDLDKCERVCEQVYRR